MPMTAYPESSFTFRIGFISEVELFLPPSVGEFLAALVLYFVSGPLSCRQPARTDMSNLKGQKGGLKGGQAGGE